VFWRDSLTRGSGESTRSGPFSVSAPSKVSALVSSECIHSVGHIEGGRILLHHLGGKAP
jgi:hypothetical protein